jgi:high-affinity iron transporter
LARFFRITGVFLVLIAAGLVMSGLRTAHEAGWVTIGQQRVFDFSGWMGTRSVLGALITGMFGIPTDPRLVEVLGWVLYASPVLIVFLWPARLAAAPRARRGLLLAAAAALGVGAVTLAVFVPRGGELPGPTRVATGADGHNVSVTVRAEGNTRLLSVPGAADVRLAPAGQQTVDGVTVDVWQAKVPTDPGLKSGTVTLAELVGLTGGRLPVGLGAARAPGPFDVQWKASTAYNVLSHGDALLHAEAASSRVATLHGGGLSSTKTVSVGGLAGDWATPNGDDQAAADQIANASQSRADHMLWKAWLPAVLALGAAFLVFAALRTNRTGNEGKQHLHGEAPQRDQIAVS